jgi:hypothetical protein
MKTYRIAIVDDDANIRQIVGVSAKRRIPDGRTGDGRRGASSVGNPSAGSLGAGYHAAGYERV